MAEKNELLGCDVFLPRNDASCGDVSFGNKILLCNKCKKKQVSRLLTSLHKLDAKKERCVKEDGDTLDVRKFNLLPQVRKVINDLKLIDVDRSWMMDNGFMIGGMLLIFNLEEKYGNKD